MMRSILNIKKKDKFKITEIKKKFTTQDVGYRAKKLKLKYAGHMGREEIGKWNVKTTFWTPHNFKRGKGRPALHWSDEIKLRKELDKKGKEQKQLEGTDEDLCSKTGRSS